jgi:hypothetical protein
MSRRDRDQTNGPPRGIGRYSEDGRWWWDDSRRQWFRTIPEVDVLEVEVEDVGGTSLVASLLTTLGTQHGVAYHRFVGRARSADARWPTYSVVGGTFPVLRAPLDDLPAQGAWVDAIQEQLGELRRRLTKEGWRPAGIGTHWWSYRYTRPGIDLDTPPDADSGEQPTRRPGPS